MRNWGKGPAQTPPYRCRATRRFVFRRDEHRVEGVVRCRLSFPLHEAHPKFRHQGEINREVVTWA